MQKIFFFPYLNQQINQLFHSSYTQQLLLHYNKKKKSKGIYGNATIDEVKELDEEGIKTEIIPWVNEKDN